MARDAGDAGSFKKVSGRTRGPNKTAGAAGFFRKFKDSLPKNVQYDDLGLEIILNGFDNLDGTKVEIGVVGDNADRKSADGRLTMGEEAIINEFGSKNMHVPARHFISGTITAKDASEAATKVMEVASVGGDIDQALNTAGSKMAEKIRERIYRGDFKPNAPATIKAKGFDHPLMDTSRLADAINHRLVRGNGDAVDSGAGDDDYQAFEVGGGE
jgi:hypothetical protein